MFKVGIQEFANKEEILDWLMNIDPAAFKEMRTLVGLEAEADTSEAQHWEGLANFLDHVADIAHDIYELDTLFLSGDDE